MKKYILALALVMATAVSVHPQSVAAPGGLVSWWAGEGNANDIYGTNNGITTGITYAAGEVGQGLVFSGSSSSYVRIPASSTLNVGQSNGFTIELWCNPATTNASGAGVLTLAEWNNNSGLNSGIGCHLEFNNGGEISFDITDSSGNDHNVSSVLGNVVPNVWQHVAVTYDKTTGIATIYRNGIVLTNGNVGIVTPSTAFDLYLGKRAAGVFAPIPYQGSMDEVSLYNRVLSASEIQAIYNAGSAGKTTPVPPTITLQPVSQTNVVGTTVRLNVAAAGTAPLSYRWSFNGTNLNNATNSTLTLTNVQPGQSGNYQVTVTNIAGSTNSAVAILQVIPPVTITPSSGLVSWWQGESNAIDGMGTNNGVAQGVTYTNGEVRQAFVFSGSSGSYVRIPVSASLDVGQSNGFTLEFWCNPATTNAVSPGVMTLAEWNNSSGAGANSGIGPHLEFYNGGLILFALSDASLGDYILESASGNVAPNVWQHVAVTYDKTSGLLTLYRNGVVLTNGNAGLRIPYTSMDLFLGKRAAGIFAPIPYQGSMDEVSLYNRALSASEIQAIYNAGSAGKTIAPVSPTITLQPVSQTNNAGATVNFSVVATGTAPLSCQWSFNGTNLNNATNTTLTLTNVQPSQAGSYSVTVTNIAGSTNSSVVALTVLTYPPTITLQPVSQTNNAGATVSFSVAAAGTAPLSYQWSFNGTNINYATKYDTDLDQCATSSGGQLCGDGGECLRFNQ